MGGPHCHDLQGSPNTVAVDSYGSMETTWQITRRHIPEDASLSDCGDTGRNEKSQLSDDTRAFYCGVRGFVYQVFMAVLEIQNGVLSVIARVSLTLIGCNAIYESVNAVCTTPTFAYVC